MRSCLLGVLILFIGVLALGVIGGLIQDTGDPDTTKQTRVQRTEPTEPAQVPPAQSDLDAGKETSQPTVPRSTPKGSPRSDAETARTAAGGVVERIVDGDTLVVRGDGGLLPENAAVRVRLLEIDAPEAGACYSDEATDRLAELLPVGSRVMAERDQELKDRYDRYLLYLHNEDGVFVNESMVASGHAEAVLYPPNDKYWERISHTGGEAERVGSGLWSGCGPSTTPPPSAAEDDEAGYPPGPPAGAPDVDCADLPGPVDVGPIDPHRLDRDGDGIGCDPGP